MKLKLAAALVAITMAAPMTAQAFPFDASPKVGPHIWLTDDGAVVYVTPEGPVVYISNEDGRSVSAEWDVDDGEGYRIIAIAENEAVIEAEPHLVHELCGDGNACAIVTPRFDTVVVLRAPSKYDIENLFPNGVLLPGVLPPGTTIIIDATPPADHPKARPQRNMVTFNLGEGCYEHHEWCGVPAISASDYDVRGGANHLTL